MASPSIHAMKDGDIYATEFPSTTAGLQAAATYCSSGGRVFVGPGTLSATASVQLFSNTDVIGAGQQTIMQRSGSFLGGLVFWDGGVAVSNVNINSMCFDNNSLAVTTRDIQFTSSSSDISIEGCRWINLTNRAGDLVRINTGATTSKRIQIRRNTIKGPGGQQTYNSFQIFDSDNVDISANVIDGFGAVKIEGSAATTCVNWMVSNNRFQSVDQTNVFTRVQNAASVTGINVTDNVCIDSGKTFLACDYVNSNDTGTMKDINVSGNVVRGFGKSFEDDAIQIGGVISPASVYCTNVTVVGNTIDGLDSTGTLSALCARGISIESGTQYVACYANTIRNCGRSGIGLAGQDYAIVGNLIERCVRRDTTASAPTPAQEGGIAIFGVSSLTCTNIMVANNICKNNGVDGTTTSNGISLAVNGVAGVAYCRVLGNRCFDDQGTPTQAYGICIGSAGNPGPDDSWVSGNDVRGNKTGGINGPLGTTVRVIVEGNVDTANTLGRGASTGSQATVTLPAVGDSFVISGTADITSITASWIGRRVTLLFSGTAATNGVVDGSNLKLSANLAYTPDDTLSLLSDGTNWIETGRSAN